MTTPVSHQIKEHIHTLARKLRRVRIGHAISGTNPDAASNKLVEETIASIEKILKDAGVP